MSATGPSARKSLRISTQGSKNENPHVSKEKHWVVAACKDDTTQNNVNDWVNLRRVWGKDYEQLDLNKAGFQNVDPKDKLYIHCHGGYPGGGDTQALWIGEGDGKPVTANKFAKYLKKNHLNPQHEILKIAACCSDEFAKKLHKELEAEYPNLTVYGYKGQFKACHGDRGGNLAGLEPPYVKQDKEGRWIINDSKIREKGATERFRAKNNRVSFGPKAEEEIKDKKDNAQSKPSSSSSPTSSLSSLSRPLVPTIAQPPARSSLSASSQSSSLRSPAEFAAMRAREALAASEVIRVMQERSQQERQQRRSQRIARQNQESRARLSRQSDSPKQNSNESSPSRSPRPSPNK